MGQIIAIIISVLSILTAFIAGQNIGFSQLKIQHTIDLCIRTQVNFYGDLIGEDPDQSPRNIVKQTGQAIKECLK